MLNSKALSSGDTIVNQMLTNDQVDSLISSALFLPQRK